LGIFDFFGVFWRSLLLQASWSFDLMQTLGFAFAIEPVLRKFYPVRTEYHARLKEHMEYFNTQPYFATFILGAVMRQEEDRANGKDPVRDISGLKTALMAPLGALGDSFFWGALNPFAAIIAVAALMMGLWWAPILYLVLFNIWHVSLRIGLLIWGYRSGGDAVSLLAIYSFTKMARLFKIISLTVLGGILGMMPLWRPAFRLEYPTSGVFIVFSCMALTFGLVAILRRVGSPIKLMFGLAIICLALAYAGVIR
jgi:mannose/fructose/N-acetylgalactosamine-specific phosphotransferase system component IID